MLVVALIAFVAGVWGLQQFAQLPPVSHTLAAGAAGLAACVVGWRVARAAAAASPAGRDVLQAFSRGGLVAGVAIAGGAAALGLAHAALLAQLRIADELAFDDEGRDIHVIGTIASLPAEIARGTRFEFDVEQVVTTGARVPARIALAWYSPGAFVRPAERWSFTVRLRRPHGTMNPGGFDVEGWLFERNIRATGYVRAGAGDGAVQRLSPLVWSFGGAVHRTRDELRTALRARLAEQRYAGVLVALVIGDQRAIADEDWHLFNRTGIAHLVSISGLHITMIAGLAAAATSVGWRRSRRLLELAPAQSAAASIAMLSAFAYCLLAGWGVPAQRTFFMLAIVCAAMLARRRPRAGTTLSFAAAVVCALDPWAVVAAGFWLSFGAVAAILYVAQGRPRQAAPMDWRRRLVDAAGVQLAVTVALVPLTIALFRQVSVVSPLANAVAIPAVSLLVTPLALAGAAFVLLPEPLASFSVPLLAVAHALFALLAELLRVAGAWSWSSAALAAPPAWTLPLSALAVAWLLAPRGWPLRGLGAVGLLPLVLLPGERPRAGELWVTALDVGQGMAVLVEAGRHALLYDTGPRHAGTADAGARVIVPYLRWRGIAALDWLVVSHLDSDHSGGAATVRRELPAPRVLTSVPAGHPVLGGSAEVVRCEAGQRFRLGEAGVEVLHPPGAAYAPGRRADNDMSCVVQIRLGAARVLLAGDLPARQEIQLLDRTADVQSALVSAPHHGSRHSSTQRFVDAVAARWVVVQAGYRNRFGHPDAAVQARWERTGAGVLRTDRDGAVQWRLSADGGGTLQRWRHVSARYWHNRGHDHGHDRGHDRGHDPPPGGATGSAAPARDPAPEAAPDPTDRTGPADSATGIEVATPPPADEPEPF